MEGDVEERAKEIVEAKTGNTIEVVPELSLVEQTKIMQDNMSKMLSQMAEKQQALDKTLSEIMVSGRGIAGQAPKVTTQEDKDKEQADKMLKMFGR